MSHSELYENIVESIHEFNFGDYGLDEVEDTKNDRWAQDWIHALAAKIDKNWGNHVDGI